jgi:hypothetical protein
MSINVLAGIRTCISEAFLLSEWHLVVMCEGFQLWVRSSVDAKTFWPCNQRRMTAMSGCLPKMLAANTLIPSWFVVSNE